MWRVSFAAGHSRGPPEGVDDQALVAGPPDVDVGAGGTQARVAGTLARWLQAESKELLRARGEPERAVEIPGEPMSAT